MSSDKIGRKKFFLITGIAAAGTALMNAIPFGRLTAADKKKDKIRIEPSPNSVRRQMRRGSKNG